ncbi:MAG: zinc ABC transporter ATP-binding protein, partial [Candidatus Magasanikbacteria bacterium CG10_big_fil_rev_8_21_14_0_10_43_6]
DGASVKESIGRIGYVPQRFSFDKTLPITVEEFLHLSVCGRKQHIKKDNINSVLDMVDMKVQKFKRLGALSGGQLQRILIARALLHERDIMILDEPSTGIDAVGERSLYKMIKSINEKKKTTFIIVSHELDFVTKYADSVVCLNRKLICHDAPEKALLCEGVKELYGSHVAVHLHHKH